MKAVMAEVPSDLLELRRQTGSDRYDEMWEGVLHMPPLPNRDQQDLEGSFEAWLRIFWARMRGAKVYHQINLTTSGGWRNKNYRIADLVLLMPDRWDIDHNEYFEGAPTAVVEIRCPDDEAYAKLAFYAQLEVPEVWVIHRDSRQPELYVLSPDGYLLQAPGEDGWILSRATGVELRAASLGKLAVRLAGDDASRRELPED